MKQPIVLILATLLLASAAAADSPKVRTIEYVVEAGDTCMGIAGKVYGDRERYDLIHKYNRKLGKLPHRMKPGTVLILPDPKLIIRPDANLTATRGPVEVQKAAAKVWDQARRGMDLFRAWKVNSHDRATAEITFRDKSLIRMRDNTLVIIYGATRRRARRQTFSAHLERGTLRSRLGELTGKKGVEVTTESAEVELGKGSALVSVDGAGASRVANHSGDPVTVRGRTKKPRSVRVKRGMGSKVERSKAPSKPRPLPPAPTWTSSDAARFAGTVRGGGTIRGQWNQVAEAASYRIEITRMADRADEELVAAASIPATVTQFEAHRLPPGPYLVTVAAIDNDAFESIPSPPRSFVVVAYTLKAPGGVASAPVVGGDDGELIAIDSPPGVPEYLVGTQLLAPDGFLCGVAARSASADLILDRVGREMVTCSDESGVALPAFAIIVAAVEVVIAADQASLTRNQAATVELRLATTLALPADIKVKAPPGVLLGPLQLDQNGRARLAVTPGAEAPATITLTFTAGEGAAEVTLGAAELEVRDSTAGEEVVAAPSPLLPAPRRAAFELGVFAGADLYGGNIELGNAYENDEVPQSSVELGVRAAYRLHRSIAVEGEVKLTPTTMGRSDKSGLVLGWRAHAVGSLPGLGRLVPFALLGLGGETLTSDSELVDSPDSDAALYWGLGGKLGLGRRQGIRLDLRHRLTAGRTSAVTSAFEAQLGYFYRFGR